MSAPNRDWMVGRANPVAEREREYANGLLANVVRHFSEKWLAADTRNPIQKLWSRKDAFATTELMILGDALSKMGARNPQWTKRRVQKAQARKPEIRIGDLFELVGLSQFVSDTQIVTPAGENQPGYDGTLELSNGAKLFISMKNFGCTTHEKHFLTRASNIESRFTSRLSELRLSGLSLLAFGASYPQEADWKTLEDTIPLLLSTSSTGPVIAGIWAVKVGDTPGEDGFLLKNPPSYQVLIQAPYHSNEKSNLVSRLDDARANFEKHHACYDGPKDYRILFVRVHETASMETCIQWCSEYLEQTANKTIDKILLYQPAILQLGGSSDEGLVHCISMIHNSQRPLFTGVNGEHQQIQMTPVIGRITVEPGHYQLQPTGTSINDVYVYQRGQVYRLANQDPGGSAMGEVKVLAPGVVQHAAFIMEGKTVVISGNFQPSSELLLFS